MGISIQPEHHHKHRTFNEHLVVRGQQRESPEVVWMAMNVGTINMVHLKGTRYQIPDQPILRNACVRLHLPEKGTHNLQQEWTLRDLC